MHCALQQRPKLCPALAQAIKLLSYSQYELAQYIREESDRNPLIEIEELYPSAEGMLPSQTPLPHFHKEPFSLPTSLETQCRDAFATKEELILAQKVLDLLDERGFLPYSLKDLAQEWGKTEQELRQIVETLQTLDPPGIAAPNLKESLLLQLKAHGEGSSLAFLLVERCFDDLLKGRYRNIQKQLRLSRPALSQAAQRLSRLRLRPLEAYTEQETPPLFSTPDLIATQDESGWHVTLKEDALPRWTLQTKYLSLARSSPSPEEKNTLKGWILSARWLRRALLQRKQFLQALGAFLVQEQAGYLEGIALRKPLSMQEIAKALNVHPSTISRALQSKYLLSPRGILPLSALLAQSNGPIEHALQGLIHRESWQNPLTDQEIGDQLKQQGFSCARRTVSKYRKKLSIGSAAQRKALRRYTQSGQKL